MQFITLNETEYPIKFTYSALMELERKQKKSFNEIAAALGTGNMTLLIEIAHAGLRTGGRIFGHQFKMKLEELGDILTPESLMEITELFGESFAPKEVQTEEEIAAQENKEIKN